MDKLLTLLSLQRKALDADSLPQLRHIMLNETVKMIAYDQAIFWHKDMLGVTLDEVSGNATLDSRSPFALELKATIKTALDQQEAGSKAPQASGARQPQENIAPRGGLQKAPSAAPAEQMQGVIWLEEQETGTHLVTEALVLLRSSEGGVLGGLWLSRESGFAQADKEILEELAHSYGAALRMQKMRARQGLFGIASHSGAHGVSAKMKWAALALILVILCWPVRLSMTAPMEIVAKDPTLITAPFEGTIERITVDAGARVKRGETLAEMEDIHLQNKLDDIGKEIEVARSELSRLRRDSLINPEKRVELKRVESEIEVKELELAYAQKMLSRSRITAPRDGVAIFADKNALQGKPVRIGDDIMTIASPDEMSILVRVPVDAMVPLGDEAALSYYLNVAPLRRYEGRIRHVGYQAGPDSSGVMSYKIHAVPQGGRDELRIGWKGTAKIYGERHILAYALIRRPLIALRELLGV